MADLPPGYNQVQGQPPYQGGAPPPDQGLLTTISIDHAFLAKLTPRVVNILITLEAYRGNGMRRSSPRIPYFALAVWMIDY